MRKEAEEHAGEDKERREIVDLKNQVDHLVHETEKQVKELFTPPPPPPEPEEN